MNDQRPKPERIPFVCKRCGADGDVGFTPRDITDLLCRECFDETGGRVYDLSNLSKAPRRKHDTRVVFRMTCSECGKDDELDYVPKGVPVSELLCKECMLERGGNLSRWALVEEQKEREQRKRKKHDVTCARCGEIDQVPFQPQADREYFCYNCYLDRQRREELGLPEQDPEPAPKHDLGDNVFIRRKK